MRTLGLLLFVVAGAGAAASMAQAYRQSRPRDVAFAAAAPLAAMVAILGLVLFFVPDFLG